MSRSAVDFPQPLGPTSETTSPSRRSRSTRRIASRPLSNVLEISQSLSKEAADSRTGILVANRARSRKRDAAKSPEWGSPQHRLCSSHCWGFSHPVVEDAALGCVVLVPSLLQSFAFSLFVMEVSCIPPAWAG